MLRDTDRPTSTDLVELQSESASSAAGVENPVFDVDSMPEDPDLVVCENLLLKADAYLSNDAGNPSAFFWIVFASFVAMDVGFWTGGIWCPCGITDCYSGELGDPLLAAAQLGGFIVSLAGFPILFQLRHAIRTTLDSPLVRLGAGSELYSLEADEALRKTFGLLDSTWFTQQHAQKSGVCVIAFCYCAITGTGAHRDAWTNHYTGAASTGLFLFGVPVMYTWVASLKFAVTLCSIKVAKISSALEEVLRTKNENMSSAQWERQVIEPCKMLVDSLQVLNDEWGAGFVWFGIYQVLMIPVWVMWLVSDISNYAAAHTGLPWIAAALHVNFTTWLIVSSLLPFVVASIPASLTSDCVAIKELLNAVRLHSMTVEIDARIAILERALDGVNGGQGMTIIIPVITAQCIMSIAEARGL
eukprot:COSAG02_NODE_127_length_34879_cov_12.705060_13_plen_415_part_00